MSLISTRNWEINKEFDISPKYLYCQHDLENGSKTPVYCSTKLHNISKFLGKEYNSHIIIIFVWVFHLSLSYLLLLA